MTSMTTMLGVVSTAVPVVLAKLAGIGDDEDEALRESMPVYLRGHTFQYFRDDEGNLKSWDLTYVNPFSLLADPVLRSIENIRRGEFDTAATEFVNALVFDQYLDPQILASAVGDLFANEDATTGNPIVEERTDGDLTKIGKNMWYLLKEAYGPKVGKDFLRAIESGKMDQSMLRKEDMPLHIFIDGVKPFKEHHIDLEKQFTRYLYETKDEYSRVRRKKYKALSGRPLSPEAVADLYHMEVKNLQKLNNDHVRIMRGFEGLGMTKQTLWNTMVHKNVVSKRRARNLMAGYMDKPIVPPTYFQNLISKSKGPNPTMTEAEALSRANSMFKAVASYGPSKYIELEEKMK